MKRCPACLTCCFSGLLLALAITGRTEPIKVHDTNGPLDFSYSWPTNAAAIFSLNRWLRSDQSKCRADAEKDAQEDRTAALQSNYPFRHHLFRREWTLAGDNERLIVLIGTTEFYTGGAHGNTALATLLWDKKRNVSISFHKLFEKPTLAVQEITKAYCPLLDAERADRRGEKLPLPREGWMTECPSLNSCAVAPVDTNRNSRFETFQILLAPYEAGPYAEGCYEVNVPITKSILTLLKPEYRSFFEIAKSKKSPQRDATR